MSLAYGRMTNGLGDMTFAGAAGSGDEYGDFFFDETPSDQFMD